MPPPYGYMSAPDVQALWRAPAAMRDYGAFLFGPVAAGPLLQVIDLDGNAAQTADLGCLVDAFCRGGRPPERIWEM